MENFNLEQTSFYQWRFPRIRQHCDFCCSGGDLSVGCLLQAYSRGIFPWFNDGEPIAWWSPDPRGVLFPENVHVSESMRKTLRREIFQVAVDDDFKEVITDCSKYRKEGTWITADMIDSYTRLAELGFAHCISVFQDGQRVGGLYGVSLGKIFCGESMFSTATNASKVAFIVMARMLQEQSYKLIDCQFLTKHLASLGCEEIPRDQYLSTIKQFMTIEQNFNWKSWFNNRSTSEFV